MSETDIQSYLDTHLQLTRAIAGLGEEQLKWKQSETTWSVAEVLAHLADHNIVVSFRIRDILADTKAQLPAFNQDLWVSGQHANDSDVYEILDAFWGLLRYNGQLFRRLGEAEFDKSGINFKGETVRVRDIIRGFAKHVQTHLNQIERIKQAYEAERGGEAGRPATWVPAAASGEASSCSLPSAGVSASGVPSAGIGSESSAALSAAASQGGHPA
ncbi:DinB family protein [Paenibacillus methanolicus]|uniref:DinB family protein n=1 Tax=Paenibacillus methanolicus TaxID=582686 RepID=A0A5S5C5Q7_9BACL|nr:DinB family protein [Paenibacillus methanolicus]